MQVRFLKFNMTVLNALTALILSSAPAMAKADNSACIDRLSQGTNKMRVAVPKNALKKLFEGMDKFKGSISNPNVAMLVDYSQSDTQKRAYLIDTLACDVLANEYVIHGGATPGQAVSTSISENGMLKRCTGSNGRTNMTRPGYMVTNGCHESQKDWPLLTDRCKGIKLVGLENRNNDVFNAGVVLHEHTLIPNRDSQKPVGQGCPAFPKERLKKMLKHDIGTGALVYLYVPQCS